MSTQYVDINNFAYYDEKILDELYKERPVPNVGTYDDFLKLPVTDEYANNQAKKKEMDNLKNEEVNEYPQSAISER
jgi:hypothetical protein